MIKKYFALSLVTASILVAGCSSDSDNTDEPDADPVPTNPEATPGVGGTSFDSIAASAQHTTLLQAIQTAGLDDALDNPDNTFTIFAPTNAAFEALDNDGDDTTLTTAELLEEANRAALVRTLQYHVLSGDIDSTAISQLITDAGGDPVSVDTILVDGATTQTVEASTSDSNTGLSVNGVGVEQADIVSDAEGAAGRVHSISGVLTAPAAPEGTGDGAADGADDGADDGAGDGAGDGGAGDGGTTPVVGNGGPVQSALESNGGFTTFLNAFATGPGLQKLDLANDPDPWTIFVPSNAVIGGTALIVNNHLQTGGALTATDLLQAGEFTSFNGITYPVGGDVGSLTVNGFPVELVGGGNGTSLTYTIGGLLQ